MHNNGSIKPNNKNQKRNYKDEVRSISKIISKESKTFTHQKQSNIVKTKTTSKHVQHEPKVNQVKQQDDSLSLELSQIHNQYHIENPIKEQIPVDYTSPIINYKNNIESDHNNANDQNQIQNNNNSCVNFDKINDGNYSQLWK